MAPPACRSFGLKVVPARAVFAALPPLFSAKLGQQRDAAKSIGVRHLRGGPLTTA